MQRFKRSITQQLGSALAASILMIPQSADAGGKPRHQEATQPGTPTVVAQPLRFVHVTPVATKPFQLPNGERVELSADLEQIVRTALATQASQFAPVDGGTDASCSKTLQIRSTVTVLDLGVTEMGLSFGYSPAGEIPTGSSVTGNAEVKVKIGTIAMDFSLWECSQGRCFQRASVGVNQKTSSVGLDLTMNFSMVTAGYHLIHRTELGKAIQKITDEGIKKLSSAPQIHESSWHATVRRSEADTGELVIDAGADERIKAGDVFTVYEKTSGKDSCDVFEAVAQAKVTRVDPVSSAAAVSAVFDSRRGVLEGDIVMVKP